MLMNFPACQHHSWSSLFLPAACFVPIHNLAYMLLPQVREWECIMESVRNPLHIIWVCSSFLGAWDQTQQIGSERLIVNVTQHQLKRIYFFQASLWPFHMSHLTFTSCEVPRSHVCAFPISPQECQTIEMSLRKAVKVHPMSLLLRA